MNLALVWRLAREFRNSRNQSQFVSFVSMSSTIGIGLGCFVLILLLSVMNGFERELRQTLLAYIPHAELITVHPQGITLPADMREKAQQDKRVKALFEINKASGLLKNGKQMKAIELRGIDTSYLDQKFPIKLDSTALANTENGIFVGQGIAQKLQLKVGDSVQVLLPQPTEDLSFKAPKSIAFTVLGLISLGGEIDDFIGLVNKQTLGKALGYQEAVSAIEFSLHDPFDGYQLIRQYGHAFNQDVYMSDWTRTNGHLYQDIQLVRTVVYIALALVICVACFNIVSSLVMAVKEKTSEIAMLLTMGASDALVRWVFILQGLINGIYGASIGCVLGALSAYYLADIVSFIERVSGRALLSGDIYFIDFLPSQLHIADLVLTYTLALLLCVLATLYPASRAVKIEPASALH